MEAATDPIVPPQSPQVISNLIMPFIRTLKGRTIRLASTYEENGHILSALEIPDHAVDQIYAVHAGRCLAISALPTLPDLAIVDLRVRCLGGKGGFGSMLRAQGGRMAKRKRKEEEEDLGSCRDLNGRRIRSLNVAKRIADEGEQRVDAERKRKEKVQDKIREGMNAVPAGSQKKFDDTEYLKTHADKVQEVKKAAQDAIRARLAKRKAETGSSKAAEEMGTAAKEVVLTAAEANAAVMV